VHACQAAPHGSAARARPSVADLFRGFGDECARSYPLTADQRRVLRHIQMCHSPTLGGYIDVCDSCGLERVVFHGCRDRHCPSCQALDQARWIQERKARILPIGHFHVVFTLPEQIRPLAALNPRLIYDLLFDCASQCLLQLGRDPKWLGGRIGITAVLHTWTRKMLPHPHLHCVVTSGGLSADGSRWVELPAPTFLFDVHAAGKLFRGKFMDALDQAWRRQRLHLAGPCADLASAQAWATFKSVLYDLQWVVWAEAPESEDPHLVQYLGRYTHRVAISDQRIIALDGRQVTFFVRKGELCTLDAVDFVHRFLLHVLPPGFTKIRHFGLYASGNVNGALARARTLLEARHPHPDLPTVAADLIAPGDSSLQASVHPLNIHDHSEPSLSSQCANDNEPESCHSEIQRLIGINPTTCPRCHQRSVRRLPLPAPRARAPPEPLSVSNS
jgi:hypothetical protein